MRRLRQWEKPTPTVGDLVLLPIVLVRPLGAVAFCLLAVLWALDGEYASAAIALVLLPVWFLISTITLDWLMERLGQ
jgi:hypothetical protein